MSRTIFRLYILVMILMMQADQLLAGPGGRIARQVFDTPMGKIILVLLVILFLPFIIYNYTREFFAVRKTKKDLKQLEFSNAKTFDALQLKNRVTDVFTRVHQAWGNENLVDCSDYMSNWYWQNQQIVHLEKWKANNLQNISKLHKINTITPLHLRVVNTSNGFNESRIVYKINAKIEDYLINRETQAVVEGKKGFFDVTTLWTFVLEDSKWKVDNIEAPGMIKDYSKMENIVPATSTAS